MQCTQIVLFICVLVVNYRQLIAVFNASVILVAGVSIYSHKLVSLAKCLSFCLGPYRVFCFYIHIYAYPWPFHKYGMNKMYV